MKDVKYCFEQFAFYDQWAIQKKLEEMALQGWLVEKAGNFLWKYRHIEPKKLHIAVTYVPNVSEFDPVVTDNQQIIEEFAKKDGWNIACRWGKMQIFYNEEENPTPMETDAVIQVETIHRAMKKSMLLTNFFILFLCVYQFILMTVQFFDNPMEFLVTPSSIYMFPVWILLIIPMIIEIIYYFRWYKKAKIVAQETGTFRAVQLNHKISFVFIGIGIIFIMISFISFGGMMAIIMSTLAGAYIFNVVLVNIFRNWMKKKGFSRGVNRFLSVCISFTYMFAITGIVVFWGINYGISDDKNVVGTYELYGHNYNIYNEELPLEIEDIIEVEGQWSKEVRGTQTIFLSQMEYKQDSIPVPGKQVPGKQVPDLSYTITEIKVPFLYEFCKQYLINEHQDEIGEDFIFYDSYFPVDETIWKAKEAYQLRWSSSILNTYLVCWEDKIVEIKFSWQVTEEEIAKVAEILRNCCELAKVCFLK